ncbi:MAG: AAA family ATPase [Planctomycetes bacterium]|nr:AAA family ATPase [Planctomycetota bacterium]
MQPHVLIIGDDRSLGEEARAALNAVRTIEPVIRVVAGGRTGIEQARIWQPHLAFLEIDTDLALARQQIAELLAASPRTHVVGVYRPDLFEYEAQQSALLIEAVRAGARDFLRRPLSSSDVDALVQRLAQAGQTGQSRVGRLVSFMSNKGGVGKSTLSVNVACSLAATRPDRVLLVDTCLQVGGCASLLDLKPETTLADAARQRDRLDETLIRQLAVPHHSGLHVLAAPADAIEGADITDEVVSRVLVLARRTYDYVIVDTIPSLDRVAMAVLDLSDLTYLVFENVVPTLLGAAKLLQLLNKLGVPAERQRLVLNRVQWIAGNPRPVEAAERLGRAVDHIVRFDRRIIAAANVGEPFALTAGRFTKRARDLAKIVREIERLAPGAPIEPEAQAATTETVASGDAR